MAWRSYLYSQLEAPRWNCVPPLTRFACPLFSRRKDILIGIRSFFQSVCVLGYCLFPLTIAALINVFVHTIFVRLPVIAVTYVWSAFGNTSLTSLCFCMTSFDLVASVSVLHGSQLEGRKWLAIYPLLLYYFVLGFTILISN